MTSERGPRHCAIAAISIDCDAIDCYYRIHALGTAPDPLRHRILEAGVTRAAALFAEFGLPATWFVCGKDVDVASDATAAPSAALIAARVQAGDEVASHSYGHAYDMARWDRQMVERDLRRADLVLASVIGRRVVGFRAPGYDISPAMLSVLVELGYHYDSSVFAAPSYYAAKAFVMATLAMRGQASGAVMTNPRALAAPTAIYRPALTAPWRRGTAPLIEIPIAVTKWARLPAIGTSLILAPAQVRDWLVARMLATGFFNFELHAIDFCDAELDGLPSALVARQPDLRVPWAAKQVRLRAVLAAIATHAEAVTLAAAAHRLG